MTKKEALIKELLAKKLEGGTACQVIGATICNSCLGCENHCVYCNCCKGGENDDWGGCKTVDG